MTNFILSMLLTIAGLTLISALLCYLSDLEQLKRERKAFRQLWEQQFFVEYDKEIDDRQQDDYEQLVDFEEAKLWE